MQDSTLFIYKIQPVRPAMLTEGYTADEERIVSEHFDYLEKLKDAGSVHLAGRTLSTELATFGIVIFSAASQEAARGIMENDPAVRQRVMRAELHPFRIALLGKFPES
jgi:uncharacterized protein YciI